jgi:hypothetical protein
MQKVSNKQTTTNTNYTKISMNDCYKQKHLLTVSRAGCSSVFNRYRVDLRAAVMQRPAKVLIYKSYKLNVIIPPNTHTQASHFKLPLAPQRAAQLLPHTALPVSIESSKAQDAATNRRVN